MAAGNLLWVTAEPVRERAWATAGPRAAIISSSVLTNSVCRLLKKTQMRGAR